MKITFKLYATLGNYLPAGHKQNKIELDVAENTTPAMLATLYKLPPELTHLVLVNGVYLYPPERETQLLKEGDVLAIWPPVAGG